jgi:hypothetical protein
MHEIDIKNVTGDGILEALRESGTTEVLVNFAAALSADEERRFWRYCLASFFRLLERTKLDDKGAILRRGLIIDLVVRSWEYAIGLRSSTDDSVPDFACPKPSCGGEACVVNLTETTVDLRCRKCGHEFRSNLATGKAT